MRRWLLGLAADFGITAVVVAFLLVAVPLSVVAFVYIVYPPSPGVDTQITLVNASTEEISLESIHFSGHDVRPNPEYVMIPDGPGVKVNRYQTIFFRYMRETSARLAVGYRLRQSGRRLDGEFTVRREENQRCRFVVFLEDLGARVSPCLRSELDDFD